MINIWIILTTGTRHLSSPHGRLQVGFLDRVDLPIYFDHNFLWKSFFNGVEKRNCPYSCTAFYSQSNF